MAHRFTIVGLGEALFDLFPDGDRLGGAPLNVAVHAHQLAADRGGRGVVVSRVGQDDLGEQVYAELRRRGMTTDYLQSDPDRPTGTVMVDLSTGSPSYDIVENVAWDVIQFDPDLEDLARHCDAVCFGSLAQRDAQARNTIYRFLDAATRAFKLFDANLRPPYVEPAILRRSCELADALKLNEDELPRVAEMIGVYEEGLDAQAAAVIKKFDMKMVVLTRGAKGTAIYPAGGEAVEGDLPEFAPADDADPVGAGDSVSAAILVGRCLRLPPKEIADLANRIGAHVAGRAGATPELTDELLGLVK